MINPINYFFKKTFSNFVDHRLHVIHQAQVAWQENYQKNTNEWMKRVGEGFQREINTFNDTVKMNDAKNREAELEFRNEYLKILREIRDKL